MTSCTPTANRPKRASDATRDAHLVFVMKNYYDIPGDGGSDILQQVADRKSTIEENLRSIRHLVAIGSGKGGVGKSTLSMQLASAWRAQGMSIAVLDADFNAPAQACLGGVSDAALIPTRRGVSIPRTREGIGILSMGTLMPDREPLDLDATAPGDSHIWRATKEFTLLGQLLATVEWGELDVLLVYLPPGSERTIQHADFFGPRMSFVLVTIPTALACGVVARCASGLQNAGARTLGYVENMRGYYCAECQTIRPLFSSKDAVPFDLPYLGGIPFDPKLAELSDSGESLTNYPDLPCSKAVGEIADRIYQKLEE